MQKQRGVTLVELLVTLAVFAIVAMIGASLGPVVRNAQLTVANNTLHAAINYARFKAIEANADVTFCPGSATGCDAFGLWSDGVAVVSATGDVLRVWSLPNALAIAADHVSIAFDGLGMVDNEANWVLCWPHRPDERMTRLSLMRGGSVFLNEVDACEL